MSSPPLLHVIFDLDGTLLDTEDLSTKSLQLAVDKFGSPFTWELKKKILGRQDLDWAKIVIDELGISEHYTPASLVEAWHINLAKLLPQVAVMKGAIALIDQLEAAGAVMGIATSSSAEIVVVKQAAQPRVFDRMRVVITGDTITNGKPAPDIFLKAADDLGVKPENCVVFEDSMSGVRAAKAAGMYTVAVPDCRMDAAVFAAEADMVIESLADFDIHATMSL